MSQLGAYYTTVGYKFGWWNWRARYHFDTNAQIGVKIWW